MPNKARRRSVRRHQPAIPRTRTRASTRVIQFLALHPFLNACQVARFLNMNKETTGSILSRLKGEGWLDGTPDPSPAIASGVRTRPQLLYFPTKDAFEDWVESGLDARAHKTYVNWVTSRGPRIGQQGKDQWKHDRNVAQFFLDTFVHARTAANQLRGLQVHWEADHCCAVRFEGKRLFAPDGILQIESPRRLPDGELMPDAAAHGVRWAVEVISAGNNPSTTALRFKFTTYFDYLSGHNGKRLAGVLVACPNESTLDRVIKAVNEARDLSNMNIPVLYALNDDIARHPITGLSPLGAIWVEVPARRRPRYHLPRRLAENPPEEVPDDTRQGPGKPSKPPSPRYLSPADVAWFRPLPAPTQADTYRSGVIPDHLQIARNNQHAVLEERLG